MQPEQFLEVAKAWADKASTCEGHRRSLVSRAYYAAFHASEQLAITLDLEFESGSRHERLVDTLKLQSQPLLRQLGNQLHDLKNMRVRSDYRLNQHIATRDIQKSIGLAEKILSGCNQQLKAKANP